MTAPQERPRKLRCRPYGRREPHVHLRKDVLTTRGGLLRMTPLPRRSCAHTPCRPNQGSPVPGPGTPLVQQGWYPHSRGLAGTGSNCCRSCPCAHYSEALCKSLVRASAPVHALTAHGGLSQSGKFGKLIKSWGRRPPGLHPWPWCECTAVSAVYPLHEVASTYSPRKPSAHSPSAERRHGTIRKWRATISTHD